MKIYVQISLISIFSLFSGF